MNTPQPPHIALLPSAGMGHLMPFLRLAAMLAKQDSIVTVITARPTVSIAESDHISSFLRHNPKINHLELQLTPSSRQADSAPVDPFFVQMHLIYQSIHLLPPLLSSSSPPFSAIIVDFLFSCQALSEAKGILMNTFERFEASTLAALNKDRVIKSLPPILPIGPLEPYHFPCDDDGDQYRTWLENQPAESVVYISFGSRTAMSRDQIRELEKGLEKTGWRFFWVLKPVK
ncbi:hypothetical protein NL676_008181 [Syzygium grande]|nr:hypothetical protein NL676_008181 [Syzygium grande]